MRDERRDDKPPVIFFWGYTSNLTFSPPSPSAMVEISNSDNGDEKGGNGMMISLLIGIVICSVLVSVVVGILMWAKPEWFKWLKPDEETQAPTDPAPIDPAPTDPDDTTDDTIDDMVEDTTDDTTDDIDETVDNTVDKTAADDGTCAFSLPGHKIHDSLKTKADCIKLGNNPKAWGLIPGGDATKGVCWYGSPNPINARGGECKLTHKHTGSKSKTITWESLSDIGQKKKGYVIGDANSDVTSDNVTFKSELGPTSCKHRYLSYPGVNSACKESPDSKIDLFDSNATADQKFKILNYSDDKNRPVVISTACNNGNVKYMGGKTCEDTNEDARRNVDLWGGPIDGKYNVDIGQVPANHQWIIQHRIGNKYALKNVGREQCTAGFEDHRMKTVPKPYLLAVGACMNPGDNKFPIRFGSFNDPERKTKGQDSISWIIEAVHSSTTSSSNLPLNRVSFPNNNNTSGGVKFYQPVKPDKNSNNKTPKSPKNKKSPNSPKQPNSAKKSQKKSNAKK